MSNSKTPLPCWIGFTSRGLLMRSSLRFRDQHYSEADDEVRDERTDTFGQTTRRSAIRLGCVPSPAADDLHPNRVRGRTLRIGCEPARVWTIPILAPFPHISFHVIQSPGIRHF